MIDYELAKQLKDAGFPYKTIWAGDYWIAPTLEELIEACGKEFGKLVQNHGSFAWAAVSKPHNNVKTGNGSTPIEAVARLFIALNPKK